MRKITHKIKQCQHTVKYPDKHTTQEKRRKTPEKTNNKNKTTTQKPSHPKDTHPTTQQAKGYQPNHEGQGLVKRRGQRQEVNLSIVHTANKRLRYQKLPPWRGLL